MLSTIVITLFSTSSPTRIRDARMTYYLSSFIRRESSPKIHTRSALSTHTHESEWKGERPISYTGFVVFRSCLRVSGQSHQSIPPHSVNRTSQSHRTQSAESIPPQSSSSGSVCGGDVRRDEHPPPLTPGPRLTTTSRQCFFFCSPGSSPGVE